MKHEKCFKTIFQHKFNYEKLFQIQLNLFICDELFSYLFKWGNQGRGKLSYRND